VLRKIVPDWELAVGVSRSEQSILATSTAITTRAVAAGHSHSRWALAATLIARGAKGSNADLDGDGAVGGSDLAILLGNWTG
jgi:hypothetical protein